MDTRRLERTKLIYHLRVFDAVTDKLLGHLVDINADGIMLIGEVPIPTGTTFRVRMDLPSNSSEPSRHLGFEVESKWCRKDGAGEFYGMGFRLAHITTDDLAVVQDLSRSFYLVANETDPVADMNPSL